MARPHIVRKLDPNVIFLRKSLKTFWGPQVDLV